MAPRIAFEDFVAGQVDSYGSYPVTRQEVIDYAREFDPQPFHLEDEAGRASLLGGLSASGWHSCAILMRLNCDHFITDSTSMGGPGIDEMKWLKPVFPGDVLSVRREILDARPSASKPDRGIVRFRFELINQKGEVVLVQINPILFGRRDAPAPQAAVQGAGHV
ncbi:MAG: MaoC family dehydratase [Phreatobacter sp.]